MLKQLRIKSYALLEELCLDFSEGFTILTGETGAGKSILVDAFGLLLGDRAASEVIRTGENSARIEGTFDILNRADLIQLLHDSGIDVEEDQTLIIVREISRSGRNRCFINGNPTTLNILRTIGDRLANLHSQHDHQSLFFIETQRDYLDNFGHLLTSRQEVAKTYEEYQKALQNLKKEQKETKRMKEQLDLFIFQLKEIDDAHFYENEEEELIQEEHFLENVEILHEHANEAYETLYLNDKAVVNDAAIVQNALEKIAEIDPQMEETLEHGQSVMVLLEDISLTLQKYLAKLEFDPDRMEILRQRLNLIRGFKKRYRASTLEEIIKYGKGLRKKIELIESSEENLEALRAELERTQFVYSQKAIELSQKRDKVAEKIQLRVEKELNDLNMKARFQIAVIQNIDPKGDVFYNDEYYIGDESGMDRIEFMLSANVGEDLAPLAKVASGGEISRTMLALKSVMAEIDPVPTLIFDEIDTGISGRIGEAVGEKLQSLAKSHQVVCITHLPQIATKGTTHYAVRKIESAGRTKTEVQLLTPEERIEETAKLMTGEVVTEAAIQHAKEMLGIRS